MKTIIRNILVLLGLCTVGGNTAFCQQADTSSYFPLGVWGIWIDHDKPPFSGTPNWSLEQQNWRDVRGNYLVFWIPMSVEGTVMDFADQNGYKMDIANFNYWYPDGIMNENSLYHWVNFVGMSDTMRAVRLIDSLRNVWGNRQGWYNYTFDQERPVSNPDFWPRVQFLARKIRELNPARKSYMVSGGAPPQEFINATPSLDILQMDHYVFNENVGQNYSAQQTALNDLLIQYDNTSNRIRGRHTEWQAIIQAQREYWTGTGCNNRRRPNFYELRVQAYLALSRGSRGITGYVYGTKPLGGSGTQSITEAEGLHTAGTPAQCDLTASIGLVDQNRNPYTATSDPDGIPGFQNVANLYQELRHIGSTMRKLRHYQAFAGFAVPANNAAGISSVGHNYSGANRIEVGTFKRMDEGADSTRYFMLVNRVCNDESGGIAPPQVPTVSFNLPTGNWEIQEVVSKKSWIVLNSGTFSDTLNPGQGKLYQIKPAIWSGTKSIENDVVVYAGATLTINAGSTVQFAANIPLTSYGRILANGTSTQRITFTKSGANNWQGIVLNGANNTSLQYCDINYATQPIVASNTSTLTISNCTINNSSFFDNNSSDAAAMRFYGSSPMISYVTINGQANSWNGVRFASGSGGSISNSTIQNCGGGNGIVVQGNSSPAISNNTIRNNFYHGIIIVSNGTGNPIITGNTVESNGIVGGVKTYNGINFYSSAGKVVENIVRYSNYGIYCDTYSSPSSNNGSQGRNLVTGNRYGLNVYYNSNPIFGVFQSNQYYGACNKFLANELYNAYANQTCNVYAQGAWWGADPPDASKIVAINNSIIEYSYWRPFDDNDCIYGPLPRVAETGTSGTDDVPTMLRQAFIARLQGNYAQAVALYRAVLTSTLKTAEQQRALVGLFEVYRDSKDPSVLADITRHQSVAGTLGLVASELLMQMYASMGRFEEAKGIALGLAQRYRNSETEQRALITLASLGGFSESQRSVSRQYLTELVERHSSTVDKGLLVALGATVSEGSAKIASGETGQSEFSISNYPNPFNPSTVIRFTLPEAGMASLKVIDLLGREVATLLNEERPAGTHQVQFDARTLPSGVYFYRLESAGKAAIQKMVLAR
ncbi:MAG TPA: right-handed parallel beta-helix repeat-containing protein [Bacteroidota bacterium]|nr:right-handed parallel beta-helix repeat-containing protein [Bacteroidota bacterium]